MDSFENFEFKVQIRRIKHRKHRTILAVPVGGPIGNATIHGLYSNAPAVMR